MTGNHLAQGLELSRLVREYQLEVAPLVVTHVTSVPFAYAVYSERLSGIPVGRWRSDPHTGEPGRTILYET